MGVESDAAVMLAGQMLTAADHDLTELPPKAREALIDWAAAYIGWSGNKPQPKRHAVTAAAAHEYAEHIRQQIRDAKSNDHQEDQP